MKSRMLLGVLAVCALLGEGCATVGKKTVKCAADPTDLFPGQDILPILSWYSIPPADLSLERYLEMKEAGFNINFSHIGKYEDAVKSLDLGKRPASTSTSRISANMKTLSSRWISRNRRASTACSRAASCMMSPKKRSRPS